MKLLGTECSFDFKPFLTAIPALMIESDLSNGLAIWVLNVDWQVGLELPLELIGLRA